MPCTLAAAALLCSCASPGVPRPPSLRLPEKASSLSAERIGSEVRLHWTTPARTTAGDAITGVLTAVICRAPVVSGKTAACAPVRQIAVTPGPAEAEDVLPGPSRVGADSLLEYRVELRNDRGRSAGLSDPAFAPAGRAPETPASLAATARREGVLLTWQPESGGAPGVVMELHRTTGALPAAQSAAGKKSPRSDIVLVAAAQADASGMVDRSAQDGQMYTYVVQRVRAVKLEGRPLELRSALSAPVSLTVHDTFPPQVPRGLSTIPGGGFGAALSVDLSWEPNGEQDLLGYNVYRSVDGGKALLLTRTAVPGPAYRDLQVAPGHTYAYRITAVDVHGNESAQGPEAHETPR